jgi:hypothetical protein
VTGAQTRDDSNGDEEVTPNSDAGRHDERVRGASTVKRAELPNLFVVLAHAKRHSEPPNTG